MAAARKPVRKPLSQQVRERMEALIREGTWGIGDKIPAEPELMELFGVGHNTVREAVQGLTHSGMLTVRRGDGTYVLAADKLDAVLDDRLQRVDTACILEARLAIEQSLVALAADCRTEADLTRMQTALDKCKTRSGHGIEDDMAFHAAIADAVRNPLLSQFYRVITAHLSRHFTEALEERQYDPAALALHDELLTALRERDKTRARQAVADIVAFDTKNIGR